MNLVQSSLIFLQKFHLSTRTCAQLAAGMLIILSTGYAHSQTPFNNNSESVLLQGFYWDIYNDLPSQGYWNMIRDKSAEIKANGFDMVWTPPPTNSSGGMGYHPRQLNDLNSTFGSRAQLKGMIDTLHANGVKAIADVVINHRQGNNDCDANFTNPNFPTEWIVANDEWNPGQAGCPTGGNWESSGTNTKGKNLDWGIAWSGARDLDHENPLLRDAIRGWMLDVLGKGTNGVGFDGWRYDVAHGYNSQWIGEYNDHTSAYFAVGEAWYGVSDTTNAATVASARQQLVSWLDQAKGKSFAFDFTTKYLLNDVLGGFSIINGVYTYKAPTYQFGRLRGADGLPAGLIGVWPGRAATFVDNHDTGPGKVCDYQNSTGQAQLAMDCAHLGQAYAYILTHPGIPTVFWPDLENRGTALRQEILDLMSYRREMGIHSGNGTSGHPVTIHRAELDIYAATIQGLRGEIAIQLGKPSIIWQPPGTGWVFRKQGLDYWVWTRPTGAATTTTAAATTTTATATTTTTTSSSSSSAASTKATVNFTCQNGTTVTGQNVYVVGSISQLGSWNTTLARKLTPNIYPVWKGSFSDLPPNTTIQWKCIKRDVGAVVWESGANTVVTTGAAGSSVNSVGGF